MGPLETVLGQHPTLQGSRKTGVSSSSSSSFVCLLYMHKDSTLIVNKCTALM